MRILVADDDNISRRVLEMTLRRLDHECVTTEDGAQAWAAFEAHRPDVVISDWMMPGLTGLELCRKIRAQGRPFTYVIIATGHADESDEISAAGADDYLLKPLDPDALRAALATASQVLSLHRRTDAALEGHHLAR